MFLDFFKWHQSFWSFLPFMEHLSQVTDLTCCHHLGTNEEPDFENELSTNWWGRGLGLAPNRSG